MHTINLKKLKLLNLVVLEIFESNDTKKSFKYCSIMVSVLIFNVIYFLFVLFLFTTFLCNTIFYVLYTS